MPLEYRLGLGDLERLESPLSLLEDEELGLLLLLDLLLSLGDRLFDLLDDFFLSGLLSSLYRLLGVGS